MFGQAEEYLFGAEVRKLQTASLQVKRFVARLFFFTFTGAIQFTESLAKL